MTISKQLNGGELTVVPQGRLDTVTAPELESAIKCEIGSIESLVLDLGQLDYISSAGLRVLLSAQKTMSTKGGMIVKNANETITEIFEVTGFSDILDIR